MGDELGQHKMGIHLEGIVALLARNLYQDPDVFVRELVQNAHDAIVWLQEDNTGAPLGGGRIDIHIDPDQRTLTFDDNGCGMTEQDVHAFVSIVGASSKSSGRAEHPGVGRADVAGIIGRFGIGLLSGFIVAERIEVITAARGKTAVRWSSVGDGTYDITRAHRDEHGTTVVLTLRAEHSHYLDAEYIADLARRYADVIGFPVFVNGVADPVNAVHAPWHLRAAGARVGAEQYTTYWNERFPGEVALDVIPLDEPIAWITDAGESRTGTVRGVLALTDRTRGSADTRGATDLFVARMFVGSGLRAILPDWASFVRGVVECDALETNAARDGVLPTPAFHAMRQAVSRAILNRLVWLAREEPTRITDIIRWHAFAVLTACLRADNADFFAAVAELIPLQTDRGVTTLRAYLKASEKSADGKSQIYYIMQGESAAQFTALGAANGHHVIYADRAMVEPLLVRFREVHAGMIELVCLDVAAGDLFSAADDATAVRFAPILECLRELVTDELRLSTFVPPDVPIAVHRTPEAERCERFSDLAADPAAPRHIREALQSLAESRRGEKVVHVNASNPVLAMIADRSTQLGALERQVLSALYHIALLTHTRSGSIDTVRRASAELQRLVSMILSDSRSMQHAPHSQEGEWIS